jgi:hypothetical protein
MSGAMKFYVAGYITILVWRRLLCGTVDLISAVKTKWVFPGRHIIASEVS